MPFMFVTAIEMIRHSNFSCLLLVMPTHSCLSDAHALNINIQALQITIKLDLLWTSMSSLFHACPCLHQLHDTELNQINLYDNCIFFSLSCIHWKLEWHVMCFSLNIPRNLRLPPKLLREEECDSVTATPNSCRVAGLQLFKYIFRRNSKRERLNIADMRCTSLSQHSAKSAITATIVERRRVWQRHSNTKLLQSGWFATLQYLFVVTQSLTLHMRCVSSLNISRNLRLPPQLLRVITRGVYSIIPMPRYCRMAGLHLLVNFSRRNSVWESDMTLLTCDVLLTSIHCFNREVDWDISVEFCVIQAYPLLMSWLVLTWILTSCHHFHHGFLRHQETCFDLGFSVSNLVFRVDNINRTFRRSFKCDSLVSFVQAGILFSQAYFARNLVSSINQFPHIKCGRKDWINSVFTRLFSLCSIISFLHWPKGCCGTDQSALKWFISGSRYLLFILIDELLWTVTISLTRCATHWSFINICVQEECGKVTAWLVCSSSHSYSS